MDAGTRAARFMLQDLGVVSPETYRFAASEPACYGIVRAGVWVFPPSGRGRDPLGGINTLWPLFGIANQDAGGDGADAFAPWCRAQNEASALICVVALVPTARLLLICTPDGGWQKAFSPDAKIGFLAIANKFRAMIDSAIFRRSTPNRSSRSWYSQPPGMPGLTIFFVWWWVAGDLLYKTALAALKIDKPTANETPGEPMPENGMRS